MTKIPIRPIRIEGNLAYVPLTQGYEAIIDSITVGIINRTNWNAKASGTNCYAYRTDHSQGYPKTVIMHRIIMSAAHGFEVDHISGNGLDNRLENLRIATHAENSRNRQTGADNTSGVKGVSWHKQRSKWHSRILFEGKVVSLGLFATLGSAAQAYADASKKLHGEFGRYCGHGPDNEMEEPHDD